MELTSEEIEELLHKAAKRAIKEYKAEEEKKAKSNKYHNTFLLMKSYRDAVFHIENAVSDAEQLGEAGEHTQVYLRSVRKSRFQTMIMKAHIDKAIAEVKRRQEASGTYYMYTAFDMYFMQGMTYEEIAEALNTGKNTPRRWISTIINELSILLWGIEEERFTQWQ